MKALGKFFVSFGSGAGTLIPTALTAYLASQKTEPNGLGLGSQIASLENKPSLESKDLIPTKEATKEATKEEARVEIPSSQKPESESLESSREGKEEKSGEEEVTESSSQGDESVQEPSESDVEHSMSLSDGSQNRRKLSKPVEDLVHGVKSIFSGIKGIFS